MCDRICAICLQETIESLSIYDTVGYKSVQSMIKELANVDLDQDNYSKVVCVSCLSKLIELLDFVHQIQDSVKFFQNTIYITYFNGRATQKITGTALTTQQVDVVTNFNSSTPQNTSPVTVVDFGNGGESNRADNTGTTGTGSSNTGTIPNNVMNESQCTNNLDDLELELSPFLSVYTPQKSESGYSSEPVTDIDADLASEVEKSLLTDLDLSSSDQIIQELSDIVENNHHQNNNNVTEQVRSDEQNEGIHSDNKHGVEITKKPVDVVIQESVDISENILLSVNKSGEQVSCCMCTEIFSNRSDLQHHVTNVHSTLIQPKTDLNCKYKCEQCHATFSLEQSLHLHLNYKHPNKTLQPKQKQSKESFGFICSICGKRFKTSTGYDFHLKTIHSEERRFVCPYPECDKAYALRKDLKPHLDTHNKKIKAYCDVCGRSFTSKNLFRRHFLSMHSETKRPYKCSKCPKRFVLADTLKSHLASHEGSRQFSRIHKCDQCDKSYCWRADLLKHKRTHQGIIPYVCHICSKGYLCTANLKYHYEVVHDIDVDRM